MLRSGPARLEAPFDKKPSEGTREQLNVGGPQSSADRFLVHSKALLLASAPTVASHFADLDRHRIVSVPGPLKQLQKWLTYSYDFDRTTSREDGPSTVAEVARREPRSRPKSAKVAQRSAHATRSAASSPDVQPRQRNRAVPASMLRASADLDSFSISSRAHANSRAANVRVGALAATSASVDVGDIQANANARTYVPSRGTLYKVDSKKDQRNRLKLESDLAAAAESIRALEQENAAARETMKEQEYTISSLRKRLDEQYVNNRKLREEHRIELQEMITRYEKRRSAWSPLAKTQRSAPPRSTSTETQASNRASLAYDGSREEGRPVNSGTESKATPAPATVPADEFSRYLDSFQLQTEKLRARLGLEHT